MSHTEKQLKMRDLGVEASYLAACSLHDTVPVLPEEPDWEALYRFCKFHSITSIAAMALEQVWKEHPADPEVMQKWRQARDKAIRKNMLLNAERERLLAYLESIGCWYMPLKGSLLQFDYPKFGMRQMSDNDILCDPAHSADIRGYMTENGYTCVQYMQGHHDEYNRKPVYNFEIHRSLFKKEEAPVLAAYYEDIRDRALTDGGKEYGHHLSVSDFYIYLIAHAYNHFLESGIGIRHLMDVYVFLGQHGTQLDWAYAETELRKLDAWEFSQLSRRLAQKLFARPVRMADSEPEELSALDAFFSSGSHGTEEQLLAKSYEKFRKNGNGSRAGYFLRRLFPPAELLGVMYPVVRKHKWMVPFVWIYRLIRSVINRPGRVLREMKHIAAVKEDKD